MLKFFKDFCGFREALFVVEKSDILGAVQESNQSETSLAFQSLVPYKYPVFLTLSALAELSSPNYRPKIFSSYCMQLHAPLSLCMLPTLQTPMQTKKEIGRRKRRTYS